MLFKNHFLMIIYFISWTLLPKEGEDEILRHALEIFRLKFIYFVQHIEGMDHLFEDTFSTLSQTGRNFSRCEIN
jgi:DNA topoisomerase-3